MPAAQTRSQKSKTTTKAAARSITTEFEPKKGNSQKGNSESAKGPGPALSAQERQMLIERAAYFRAERRGFVPGGELQDWIEAEAEILLLTGGA